MCITEKKFKKQVGKLWLGNNDLLWLGDIIDQAVKSQSLGEFFKHRRDGYKAIHVIRRANKHGTFLETSEFHSGSRQGVIRIPEGEARQGWRQFSRLCRGFKASTVVPQRQNPIGHDRERRKGQTGGEGLYRETERREPHISQNFESGISVNVNPAVAVMANDTLNIPINTNANPTVNARVALVINMELECGPTGQWDISWAKVIKSEAGAQSKTQPAASMTLNPGQREMGPNPHLTRAPQKQVWRPKSNPIQNGSSLKYQTSGSHSNLLAKGTQLKNPTESMPLDRAADATPPADMAIEASSEVSDWALQLRDGRRLVVPSIPMAPLSSNPFFALSSECLAVGKCFSTDLGGVSAEEWTESGELDIESSLQLSKYEQEGVVSDEEGWDEDAMWVEPLAISPPEVEVHIEEKDPVGTRENSTGDIQPPKSSKGP